MTEDAILQAMKSLNALLDTWHDQINAIADCEATAVVLQQPIPYENLELAKTKAKLVERSAQVIDQLQKLHDRLISTRHAG